MRSTSPSLSFKSLIRWGTLQCLDSCLGLKINGCVLQPIHRRAGSWAQTRYGEDLWPHGPDTLNRKELTNADWSVTSHRLTSSQERLNTQPSQDTRALGSDHRSWYDWDGRCGRQVRITPTLTSWFGGSPSTDRPNSGEISNMTVNKDEKSTRDRKIKMTPPTWNFQHCSPVVLLENTQVTIPTFEVTHSHQRHRTFTCFTMWY